MIKNRILNRNRDWDLRQCSKYERHPPPAQAEQTDTNETNEMPSLRSDVAK